MCHIKGSILVEETYEGYFVQIKKDRERERQKTEKVL